MEKQIVIGKETTRIRIGMSGFSEEEINLMHNIVYDKYTVRTWDLGDQNHDLSSVVIRDGLDIFLPSQVTVKAVQNLVAEFMNQYSDPVEITIAEPVILQCEEYPRFPKTVLKYDFRTEAQKATYSDMVGDTEPVTCLGAKTGSGKTYMMIRLICSMKVRTMVMCHTLALEHQFCEAAIEHAGFDSTRFFKITRNSIVKPVPQTAVIFFLTQQTARSLFKDTVFRNRLVRFIRKNKIHMRIVDEANKYTQIAGYMDILFDNRRVIHATATPYTGDYNTNEARCFHAAIPAKRKVGGDEYPTYHTVLQVQHEYGDDESFKKFGKTVHLEYSKWVMKNHFEEFSQYLAGIIRYLRGERDFFRINPEKTILIVVNLIKETELLRIRLHRHFPDQIGILYGGIPVDERKEICRKNRIVIGTVQTVGVGVDYPISAVISPIHYSSRDDLEQIPGRSREDSGYDSVMVQFENVGVSRFQKSADDRIGILKGISRNFMTLIPAESRYFLNTTV